MTTYSVYEPADEEIDVERRADKVAFVKEGFSWPAFFVPALWLIYHRMWLELILLVAIFSVLPWALGLDADAKEALRWISLGLFMLFAFEANDLRSASLQRKGYRLAGVVTGRDRDEAERFFFKSWPPLAERPARGPQAERKALGGKDTPAPAASGDGEEVIGLFPRP